MVFKKYGEVVAVKCCLPHLLLTAQARAIDSFPLNESEYLAHLQAITKFCADRNFIYITMHWDEGEEELQSYYKLTNEDMEEIIKEWSAEFLVPVEKIELSNPYIIGSHVVTRGRL
jgi:hypothetical protein